MLSAAYSTRETHRRLPPTGRLCNHSYTSAFPWEGAIDLCALLLLLCALSSARQARLGFLRGSCCSHETRFLDPFHSRPGFESRAWPVSAHGFPGPSMTRFNMSRPSFLRASPVRPSYRLGRGVFSRVAVFFLDDLLFCLHFGEHTMDPNVPNFQGLGPSDRQVVAAPPRTSLSFFSRSVSSLRQKPLDKRRRLVDHRRRVFATSVIVSRIHLSVYRENRVRDRHRLKASSPWRRHHATPSPDSFQNSLT